MPKFVLNNLLNTIDIVSFFNQYFNNYTFEKHSNSFVLKNSVDIFEIDRFIFFKEENQQFYYHFKTQIKGNLLDLILNSNIVYFDKVSKIKVGILILKKYVTLKTENFKYTYFTDFNNQFLNQYLIEIFAIKKDKEIFLYKNKKIIPIYTDIHTSIIKTFRYLEPELNYTLKTHHGFYYQLLERCETLDIYFSQNKFFSLTKENLNTNKICLFENQTFDNIKNLIRIIDKNSFKKIKLINESEIRNRYFILLFILEYTKIFYNISVSQHRSNNSYNNKLIQLIIYFNGNKSYFIKKLSFLINKLKTYNKKLIKDYNLITQEQNTDFLKLNTFSVSKINEQTIEILIPYEKEALQILNQYLLKTLLDNLIVLSEQ